MPSHISFLFTSALLSTLNAEQCSKVSTTPLSGAIIQVLKDAEFKVILQSIDHFLATLDYYELSLSRSRGFDAIVDKQTIFMFATLKGSSKISDSLGNLVSETKGKSCTLCFLSAGEYIWEFAAGLHKMMILSFNYEYIRDRCNETPEFKPLIDAIEAITDPYLALPHCTNVESIFNLLQKQLGTNSGHLSQDTAINSIITGSLDSYQSAIVAKQYDANTINKNKIIGIISFIKKSYKSYKIDDLRTLSSKFHISESSLKSLIKNAFQTTLKKYVLKRRMEDAMDQLLTTKKLIKDIGYDVGYTNPPHFSKVFKNYYHKIPSEITRQ